MGRFTSKFNPILMAQTAKQLVFGKTQERDKGVSEGESEMSVFNILESSKVSIDKGKKKRVRGDQRDVERGIAVRDEIGSSNGSEIRLFGKSIKVGQAESSKSRSEVKRVYTLGELIRKDKMKVKEQRATAVSQRTEPVRHYAAVTRASLSPGVGLLEGKGDNFKGTDFSPSSTIFQLFTHVFGCFSPVGFTGQGSQDPTAEPTSLTVNDPQIHDQFSFVTPRDDVLHPYDAVEEWWPRRASPSLQFSVTHIDPYIERHPVWMERYHESMHTTQDGVNEVERDDNGNGEDTVTYPNHF